jgi:hypothetical protein
MPFFSKEDPKKTTQLFFATDLHGPEQTYRRFINAGKFYDAGALMKSGADGKIQGHQMTGG